MSGTELRSEPELAAQLAVIPSPLHWPGNVLTDATEEVITYFRGPGCAAVWCEPGADNDCTAHHLTLPSPSVFTLAAPPVPPPLSPPTPQHPPHPFRSYPVLPCHVPLAPSSPRLIPSYLRPTLLIFPISPYFFTHFYSSPSLLHALPCSAPLPGLPCHALPCSVLSCPALPYPTPPCPVLSCPAAFSCPALQTCAVAKKQDPRSMPWPKNRIQDPQDPTAKQNLKIQDL